MSLKPGKIIEGKVVNITKFGAFVEVEGKIGLLHISEISKDYVKDISKYLKENQKIKVKVISIDDNDKISLSVRAIDDDKKTSKPEEVDWNRKKPRQSSANFEDTLSKFLKESEEKFKELKSYKNSRSNGYNNRKS